MITDGPIKRDAHGSLDFRKAIAKLKVRKDKFDSRQIALAGLYELASEHQSAILLMILFEMFSSAQALLRPCVEASIRTVWLSRCITQVEFEKLQASKKWPGLDQLIGKVEVNGRIGGALRKLIPPRRVLNDLTHGGFMQIADRLYPALEKFNTGLPNIETARQNTAALCIKTADRMLCLAALAFHSECSDADTITLITKAYDQTRAAYELRAGASPNRS